jgi:hypothetical protein
VHLRQRTHPQTSCYPQGQDFDKTLSDSWLVGKNDRDKVAGWSFAALQKGWSSQELGYQWLTEVYQPQTKTAAEEGHRRLLNVDGHGSHLSARFVQFCLSHNINLLVLPHTLQCSVGVYRDPKKALSWFAKHRWSCLDDRQGISKRDFIFDLADARVLSMKKHHVNAGWEGSGIYPCGTMANVWTASRAANLISILHLLHLQHCFPQFSALYGAS